MLGALLTAGYRNILLITGRWKENPNGEHGHRARGVGQTEVAVQRKVVGAVARGKRPVLASAAGRL